MIGEQKLKIENENKLTQERESVHVSKQCGPARFRLTNHGSHTLTGEEPNTGRKSKAARKYHDGPAKWNTAVETRVDDEQQPGWTWEQTRHGHEAISHRNESKERRTVQETHY